MMRVSSWSGPSAAVATWIVSRLRGVLAMAALSAMARPESSSSESSTPVPRCLLGDPGWDPGA